MRWRQSLNEETGKYEFIPVDDAARRHGSVGASIHGDISPFVSPVDGSVVSDRAQLREHNKRNNVVNYHEFDAAKQKDTSRESKEESLRTRQAIYERVIQAERGEHHGR
jgi:hypothetical protein